MPSAGFARIRGIRVQLLSNPTRRDTVSKLQILDSLTGLVATDCGPVLQPFFAVPELPPDGGHMATSAQAPVRNPNAVQGRFTWHDLMTTDPDAAKAFYTAVAGWGTQDWPGTTPPYTMFLAGDAMVGGVMQLPDEAIQQGAMSHWLTYIETQDVDETFALATKLGASTYVQPTDIPTVGRFAVLADPQGAMFALFT